MVHTGEHDEYHWLVSTSQIWPLTDLMLRFNGGLHVCITSFDSGPIRLSQEEISQGWSMQGKVAISPPIIDSLTIPHDQYDEWYILAQPAFDEIEIEVFVNYGAFTVVSLAETCKTFDPSWEKNGLDWLAPIQERFWSQLQIIKPEIYIGMGDNDVVVSRNRDFIQSVRDADVQRINR